MNQTIETGNVNQPGRLRSILTRFFSYWFDAIAVSDPGLSPYHTHMFLYHGNPTLEDAITGQYLAALTSPDEEIE